MKEIKQHIDFQYDKTVLHTLLIEMWIFNNFSFSYRLGLVKTQNAVIIVIDTKLNYLFIKVVHI